jgi:hypothetical protein
MTLILSSLSLVKINNELWSHWRAENLDFLKHGEIAENKHAPKVRRLGDEVHRMNGQDRTLPVHFTLYIS